MAARMRTNENKMSYRYRERACPRSESDLVSRNLNMRRVAVSSIAWLDRWRSTRIGILLVFIKTNAAKNTPRFLQLIFSNEQSNGYCSDQVKMCVFILKATKDPIGLEGGSGDACRARIVKCP